MWDNVSLQSRVLQCKAVLYFKVGFCNVGHSFTSKSSFECGRFLYLKVELSNVGQSFVADSLGLAATHKTESSTQLGNPEVFLGECTVHVLKLEYTNTIAIGHPRIHH